MMLNFQAKEYVPPGAAAPASPQAPGTGTSAGCNGATAQAKQLSVSAAAYVPRASPAPALSPNGVSQRSCSDLSSHAPSPDEEEAQATATSSSTPRNAPAVEAGWVEQGGGEWQGDVTAPAYGMYDYSCGYGVEGYEGSGYEAYGCYPDGAYYDPYGGMTYGNDGTSTAAQVSYCFWDEAAGAYVYTSEYDAYAGDAASWSGAQAPYWQQSEHPPDAFIAHAPPPPPPPPPGSASHANGHPRSGSAGSATARPRRAALPAASSSSSPASASAHRQPTANGTAGTASPTASPLSSPDALELLSLFFPHYSTDALGRLLSRRSDNLSAAFSELCAMERAAGDEAGVRGGRGGSSGGGGGRSGGGAREGGGRGPGGVAKKAGAFKLDLEAFPTLPPPPTSPGAAAAAAAPRDEQQQQPVEEQGSAAAPAAAPSAPAAAAAATTAAAASHSPKPNFAALLRSGGPGSPAAAAAASPPAAPAVKPAAAAAGGGGRGMGRAAAGGGGGASGSVPWVATGAAVAAQYGEERREAAALARARNQYFQQATSAYLIGNKALAKELGAKGRAANEAMKAAHARAAAAIFASRNRHLNGHPGRNGHIGNDNGGPKPQPYQARRPAAQAAAGGQQEGSGEQGQREAAAAAASAAGGDGWLFVDLHGLHAAEAVAAVEAQVAAARAAGCRALRICTGTGHHTKGAKTPARLPAAVADALLSAHITFRPLQPGLLEATL